MANGLQTDEPESTTHLEKRLQLFFNNLLTFLKKYVIIQIQKTKKEIIKMLNPYKYRFRTWAITKDGQKILLEDFCQQLFLLTDKESEEVYHRKYSFEEWDGCTSFYIHKGFKNFSFWRRCGDKFICKIKIDNLDYFYLERTFEPTVETLKEIFESVKDSNRVIEYLQEKRFSVAELVNTLK